MFVDSKLINHYRKFIDEGLAWIKKWHLENIYQKKNQLRCSLLLTSVKAEIVILL